MTRTISPEHLQPTPVEQQADPSIVNPDRSVVLLEADPYQTRPGVLASVAQRFRGGSASEQEVTAPVEEEAVAVPVQRLSPRIIMPTQEQTESSQLLSISPVSENTRSVRIIAPESAPAPVEEVEEKAVPVITIAETTAEASPTAIPDMTAVVKPVRRQKERPARAKASVRKRARKAAVAAMQTPAEPVAESKPNKGRKEAQKISMIGGLALARMTGGRLAFRRPNVKLPRRTKSAEQTVEVTEPAVPKEKFSVSKKLNDVQNELYFGTKNRIHRLNKSELNEKLYQRKGMLAAAMGAIAVVGVAYAAHKGFDINFGEQGTASAAPNADGGVAQTAAEQATAPQTFDNPGVNPEGAGVSTAPIGSAEAAEIASATAETVELQGSPELQVATGAGFTDLYMDSANQLGVELTGQEAYDIHIKMQTMFGGDIITGDTYQMSNGDYGISSPGNTTWNPDAQRFFEELLEETKKKKLAS